MMSPSEKIEKKPPRVVSENDIPFDNDTTKEKAEPLALAKDTPRMEERKFNLGATTLGWCIGLMCGCVILSLAAPDNSMIESAFEAFKLIVMTVLGYIFGSESKK